nr:DUF4867 family protein [uncultured Cellulosilyticum sp.]
MEKYQVSDKAFKAYGRVLTGYDCSQLMKEMEHMPMPEDVVYEPSVFELEQTAVAKVFAGKAYGEMPIQIGYCNGHNQKLNAVEYHRNSEINIAVTDMILLLGKQQDITDELTYDTNKIEAFFVPKGTVVELYATTLHYAPCGIDGSGFKAIVILPKGTNYDKTIAAEGANDDKLMTHRNKWLIAHEEAHIAGAFVGLVGENIEI